MILKTKNTGAYWAAGLLVWNS